MTKAVNFWFKLKTHRREESGGRMENFNVEEERKYLGIVATRKTRGRNNKSLNPSVRSVKVGLSDDWIRATFIVRESYLEKLKDYAYTERVSIKDALDMALGHFLQDLDDLLPHNKESQTLEEIVQAEGGRVYDVRQVALILNRSPLSIYNYIHQGKLKAKKVSNSFFVTESALKEFAQEHAIVNDSL